MKIKLDKRDILFSKLVRERAEWACEFCGKHYGPGDTRGLECAHIYGRSRKGLRWHPDNAVALCTGHHMYFTGNPLEFSEWITGHIGKKRAAALRIMAAETFTTSKPILDDIHANLKVELERMTAERMNGKRGRLGFASPYST